MLRSSYASCFVALFLAFGFGAGAQAEKAGKRPRIQKQADQPHSLEKAKTPKLERVETPRFAIKTIAVAPVGPGGVIQQGKHVMLDIRVENTSKVDGLGTEKVQLTCTKISGSGCPVTNSLQSLPKIKAGSSHSIILVSAQGAHPGKYKVRAFPVGGGRGSDRTVTLNVGGKAKPDGSSASSPTAHPGVAGLGAAQVPMKLTRHPKWKIHKRGEPQWKHASCTVAGPVEFPHVVFKNDDSVVFPAGSKIIYLLKSDLQVFSLGAPLLPGGTTNGPSFEAFSKPGKPYTCVAVGKL